jgi:hypothetical protein
MVWYGMVWYGMVWYGMVWYGMVWYGMVWYGVVWYGMVWYGMAWHGMVWVGGENFFACGGFLLAAQIKSTQTMRLTDSDCKARNPLSLAIA